MDMTGIRRYWPSLLSVTLIFQLLWVSSYVVVDEFHSCEGQITLIDDRPSDDSHTQLEKGFHKEFDDLFFSLLYAFLDSDPITKDTPSTVFQTNTHLAVSSILRVQMGYHPKVLPDLLS